MIEYKTRVRMIEYKTSEVSFTDTHYLIFSLCVSERHL